MRIYDCKSMPKKSIRKRNHFTITRKWNGYKDKRQEILYRHTKLPRFKSMSGSKNTFVMVVVFSIRLLFVIELTKANLEDSSGRNIRKFILKLLHTNSRYVLV